jgi:hypothetical protein
MEDELENWNTGKKHTGFVAHCISMELLIHDLESRVAGHEPWCDRRMETLMSHPVLPFLFLGIFRAEGCSAFTERAVLLAGRMRLHVTYDGVEWGSSDDGGDDWVVEIGVAAPGDVAFS